MFDLTLITPTGDRPDAFALCDRFHLRRTKPWRTILYAGLAAVGSSAGTLACAKALGWMAVK